MIIEETQKLPTGWRWTKFGKISELNPRRPRDLDRANDAPTTFVPMPAVDERTGTIARPEIKPFKEVRKGYTYFAEGDVLFAKITPCMQNGKHAVAGSLIDGIGFGSTEFHVVRPGQNVVSEWLHYFLRQPVVLRAAMEHFTGAVGQQRVSDSFLADLDVPLPPLPEQKRIAAILTEKMAAVENARVAAEERLKAAKELSTAYLREVFESDEAKGWPILTLDDVCRDISDGTHFTPTYVPRGTPFLSVKDVKEAGISFDNCKYVTEEQHQELCRRCKPEFGDVLYTKVGTTGIAKWIDTEKEFSIFVSVALLKLKQTITPQYLERVLNAPICRLQAEDLTQGMANRNLVLRDIKKIEIPVPSLSDQKKVVAHLDRLSSSVSRIASSAKEELNSIKSLPAALLRQAFSGEL